MREPLSLLGFLIIGTIYLVCFLEDFIRKNYDNRKGLNIKINKNYEKVDEMAYAALEELKKQGKKCEITEMKEGYLTIFTIDEKKYKMMYKMDTTGMYSFLLIQLIPCK